MMQYATIRAPFNGVITKRYANIGSMIQAGISSQTQAMPFVKLAQDHLPRLVLPVPVSAVADIRNGQVVDVEVTSTGRKLQGKISRYADSVQMATRTMETEVDVPNPDGSLVPGMYAEVHLHLANRPTALSVPIDAVDGLGTSVQQAYIVRDGIVHLINVKIGLQTAGRIEILSGMIFLGSLRATVAVSFSVPLSLLATFFILKLSGSSINRMVLGGLALALSRLIDNSVVVLENIFRHLEEGESPLKLQRRVATKSHFLCSREPWQSSLSSSR
jgi:multidrug efflux pump subunit AcrA (membrane-fusion protein)